MVVSCSVFEHLLGSEDIDNIVKLVKKDSGVLAIHTLVCEDVPCDPTWFYLLPVHCSFYSNKAMCLLFEKYGFQGCFYNLESRMWFLFYDFKMMERFGDIVDTCFSKEGWTWAKEKTFVQYWK